MKILISLGLTGMMWLIMSFFGDLPTSQILQNGRFVTGNVKVCKPSGAIQVERKTKKDKQANDQPINDVKVTLVNSDVIVTTNEAGNFVINVPNGKQTLRFSKDGFKIATIAINGKENLLKDICLKRLTIESSSN